MDMWRAELIHASGTHIYCRPRSRCPHRRWRHYGLCSHRFRPLRRCRTHCWFSCTFSHPSPLLLAPFKFHCTALPLSGITVNYKLIHPPVPPRRLPHPQRRSLRRRNGPPRLHCPRRKLHPSRYQDGWKAPACPSECAGYVRIVDFWLGFPGWEDCLDRERGLRFCRISDWNGTPWLLHLTSFDNELVSL